MLNTWRRRRAAKRLVGKFIVKENYPRAVFKVTGFETDATLVCELFGTDRRAAAMDPLRVREATREEIAAAVAARIRGEPRSMADLFKEIYGDAMDDMLKAHAAELLYGKKLGPDDQKQDRFVSLSEVLRGEK